MSAIGTLADDLGQAIEFAGDLLVEPDHFVEQDRDLALVVGALLAQPDGEVTAPQFPQCGNQLTAGNAKL